MVKTIEERLSSLVNESSYVVADDLTKQKQREHSTHLHTRLHESKLKALEVKRSHPPIWQAISDLEPELLTFHPEGLRFQHKIYVGVVRAGTKYLNLYLLENHIIVSQLQMLVLRGMAFFKRFTTYDELFEFLRDENCGDLEMDKGNLTKYPTKTSEEEKKERVPEPKQTILPEPIKTDPRDELWLGSAGQKRAQEDALREIEEKKKNEKPLR